MATRFYLPGVGTAPISPAFDASWEATGAPTRRPLELVKATPTNRAADFDPIVSVAVAEAVNNTSYDVAVAQFISAPLNGNQTIAGNIKGIIRAAESTGTADMRAQMVIRVLNGAGTVVRGTLIASNAGALSNEFATSLTNRRFPLGWAGTGQTPTSVAALDGDRIVIEVGFRSHEASATSRTGTLSFGTSAGTDAPEDETGTAEVDPWIEFADTLAFKTIATRVSQTVALAGTRPTNVPVRVSQTVALAGTRPTDSAVRVSQTVVLVATSGSTSPTRVSQTVLLVATPSTPASRPRFWARVIG